jgi:hypothetical protein
MKIDRNGGGIARLAVTLALCLVLMWIAVGSQPAMPVQAQGGVTNFDNVTVSGTTTTGTLTVTGATTLSGAVTCTNTGPWTIASTNTVAGGDAEMDAQIVQSNAVTLTGTLRGVYGVATNGTAASGDGTIRGGEFKARAANSSNVGGNVALLEAGLFSADAKNKTAATLRGITVQLDGGAGGASTTATGLEVDNNSSATQTNSYGLMFNEGTASGHKTYTKDIVLQQGETIDNATDGTIALTGAATVSGALGVAGVSNLDGGIAVDTSNFTVDGTTGAVATASKVTVGTFEVLTKATPIAVTAALAILPTGTYQPITASGVITDATLATTNIPTGAKLILINAGSTNAITILKGSTALVVGGTSVALGPSDTATFIFDGSHWVEVAATDIAP